MKVLWGVKNGDEDWKEDILSTEEENFPTVTQRASADGYGRFRISDTSDDGDVLKSFSDCVKI